MKKIVISVLVLATVFCFSAAAQSEQYFRSGGLMLGGSSSFYLDLEGSSGTNIYLNPDIGFFPLNNVLCTLGIDSRFYEGDMSVEMESGLTYFFSGGIIVPYLSALYSTTLVDDFYGFDSYQYMWLTAGLDLFLMENLAVYTELRSPSYVISESDSIIGSSLGIRFGFHFYIPAGPFLFAG